MNIPAGRYENQKKSLHLWDFWGMEKTLMLLLCTWIDCSTDQQFFLMSVSCCTSQKNISSIQVLFQRASTCTMGNFGIMGHINVQVNYSGESFSAMKHHFSRKLFHIETLTCVNSSLGFQRSGSTWLLQKMSIKNIPQFS